VQALLLVILSMNIMAASMTASQNKTKTLHGLDFIDQHFLILFF
jgi:hypothetical protein